MTKKIEKQNDEILVILADFFKMNKTFLLFQIDLEKCYVCYVKPLSFENRAINPCAKTTNFLIDILLETIYSSEKKGLD